VLYDVSTLYFETDAGDGFREPGFSNERRLDPQITIGLLTNAAGFPLMVHAFEGNRAETTTMPANSATSARTSKPSSARTACQSGLPRRCPATCTT
jgi:transposase